MQLEASVFTTFKQHPDIGNPVRIPVQHEDQVAFILRALIAIADEDDSPTVISEGEPYETLQRKLEFLSRSVLELGSLAKMIVR